MRRRGEGEEKEGRGREKWKRIRRRINTWGMQVEEDKLSTMCACVLSLLTYTHTRPYLSFDIDAKLAKWNSKHINRPVNMYY